MIPIILPNQKLKLLFDIWQAILIIIRMVTQTIKLGFCTFIYEQCIDFIDNELLIIMLVSFFFEILINFNTGFFEKGIVIQQKTRIIKHYLFTSFIPDILAAIPLVFNLIIDEKSDDFSIKLGKITKMKLLNYQ